jgi:prephenate dehydrogenase
LARCLIIGCGCRGLELAALLRADGHAVRGTTRDPSRVGALDDAGVEAVVADPDRVATVAPVLDHVVIACVLLGSATAAPESLAALHTSRLEMLLTRMVDSTVRGILYEARGTVEQALLEAGAMRVRAVAEDSQIPYVLLDADPQHHAAWALAARDAVADLLA